MVRGMMVISDDASLSTPWYTYMIHGAGILTYIFLNIRVNVGK